MSLEELTDWKVEVILDRKALVEDITKLEKVLARRRTCYITSAGSEAEALKKTEEYVRKYLGIGPAYVRAMHPRRLPT